MPEELSLKTTSAAGNGQRGVAFEITPNKKVTIKRFSYYFYSGSHTVEIYYRVGGVAAGSSGWNLVGTASVTQSGVFTEIPIAVNVVQEAGSTYGWYITNNDGTNLNYTNGDISQYSNADLALANGYGSSYPFKMDFSPRMANCIIYYEIPPLIPTVTTQAATFVQATTARLNGQISNDGGAACQYRFRYKKSGGAYSYTTWTGAKTTGQTFYANISGLDKKSLYYFNAQAKNSAGISAWGSQRSFTTLATIPTVTTQAVTNIGTTTATGNGNITDNGGENCSKRGVCWNTTGNPTVADSKSEQTDSFGTGAFTRPMTGLSPSTHYYVKAYAYNSAGYGYGSQVEFDTPPAYTVHEVEVSDGIALTDNLVKTPMLFRSDGLALSDVLVKAMDKGVTDGIAFKDILVKTIDKRLTDAIAFKDTLVKTISKVLVDGIAFKDVISYLKNPTKLAKLIRKLLQLEGISGGKEDAISYERGPTKLAKLIRKLLQLEDIGGGKED